MDFLRFKARTAWVAVMRCFGREQQAQNRGKLQSTRTSVSDRTNQLQRVEEFNRLTNLSFIQVSSLVRLSKCMNLTWILQNIPVCIVRMNFPERKIYCIATE